jgi:predicted amidohydrolase
MRIAVHQMTSGIDLERNCTAILHAIREAAADGAVMYFAPEMALLLDRNRERASQSIVTEAESAELRRIADAAQAEGIWVHLGSMAVASQFHEKFANRTIIIGPDGLIRARYDKMHLFDVDLESGEHWRESSAYQAGDNPVVLSTPLGSMALTICYDIRFPELFAVLSKARVDIITVPSAFTVPTGLAHWHVLLRARAIEAEAFVIAAAQSGSHEDGRSTFGHSLVVDPWGDVLLDMGEGEGLGLVEIDLSRLAKVREQIPVHQNRRDIGSPTMIG